MTEHTRTDGRLHEGRPGALGILIHEAVRRAIEVAVEEELTAALGAKRYARDVDRGGYRDGRRSRALTGPTGPLALTLPRATLFRPTGTFDGSIYTGVCPESGPFGSPPASYTEPARFRIGAGMVAALLGVIVGFILALLAAPIADARQLTQAGGLCPTGATWLMSTGALRPSLIRS